MTRDEYRAAMRAQGVSNAYAALQMVREWGGALPLADLRKRRLGRGAMRAVRMGLCGRAGKSITLNESLSASADHNGSSQ